MKKFLIKNKFKIFLYGLPTLAIVLAIMILTFQIMYISGSTDYPQHSDIADRKSSFSFDNQMMYGLLNFGKPVSNYIILDKQSYAIGTNGERYFITSKDHEYNDYIRIYLKDSNGKNKYSLERGKWRFVIFYKTIGKDKVNKVEHNVTMQRGHLYIMLIDGAPN